MSYTLFYISFAESNGQQCPESYESLQAVYEASVEKNRVEDTIEMCKISQEEVFMNEVRYEGLLDSCCSAYVMGKDWKDEFLRICQIQTRRRSEFWMEGHDLSLVENQLSIT